MSAPILHEHADRESCIAALAEVLAARMMSPGCVLLPGGSTPQPLLQRLAGMPLDWDGLLLCPGDERWVPASAEDSNLRLLRSALPGARLLDPRQAEGLQAAAVAWGSVLREHLPLSVALLGMGEDGHFASLFPGMPGLDQALDPAAEPAALCALAPVQPHQRLSVNLAMLLTSRWLGLLVFGAAKRELLLRVLADPAASDLPIAALVRAAGCRLHVWWAP